jgi:integrase
MGAKIKIRAASWPCGPRPRGKKAETRSCQQRASFAWAAQLTDPATGKPRRHNRSRVVGYKPKMHRAHAEKILGAELAAINGGPVTRAADGRITWQLDEELLHPHARARKRLAMPIYPDNSLRLCPVANRLGIAFHPTFQLLRRSFSTHGKKEAHPTEMQAQLGHSDIRTTPRRSTPKLQTRKWQGW